MLRSPDFLNLRSSYLRTEQLDSSMVLGQARQADTVHRSILVHDASQAKHAN